MKVTMHLAISADGFIAKPDGDSDWVAPADEVLFLNRVKEAGCLVVGRKTFEQYKNKMYPVEGVVNIVLSRTCDLEDPNILVATSPTKAIELARENGCTGILIARRSERTIMSDRTLLFRARRSKQGCIPRGLPRGKARAKRAPSAELAPRCIPLIAGGARVAGSFLEKGLIDVIFFSIHPLLLGQGMRVFDGLSHDYRLKLIGSTLLTDGLVELQYKLG